MKLNSVMLYISYYNCYVTITIALTRQENKPQELRKVGSRLHSTTYIFVTAPTKQYNKHGEKWKRLYMWNY